MSEYIEREALLNELQEELEFETPMYTAEQNKWINTGLRIVIKDVKRQPTTNVVEVVYCKDCKHYQKNTCPKRAWAYTEPDDFCSDGEKREVI